MGLGSLMKMRLIVQSNQPHWQQAAVFRNEALMKPLYSTCSAPNRRYAQLETSW